MSKTSDTPATTTANVWAEIQAAATPIEKHRLARWAVEAVEVPGFDHPVPRFFFDLPWAGDDNSVVDSILADIITAEDITTVTDRRESRKLADIKGRPVVVHGIEAARGDLEDSRWGAYLKVTISVDGGDPELFFVSSAQVTVTLWRLFMEGRLPAEGVFVEVAAAKKGQSAPMGFQVEEAL